MKPDCAAFSLSHPMGEGRGEGAPAYWLRVQMQMEAFDEPACGITGNGNTQDCPQPTPALSSLGGRRGRQQVERWEKSEIASFGFSLTDLLVVLAVLSLLGAIVAPFLVKSRAQSKLTVCLSNLQQVTRAVLQYSEENKGILPAMENAPVPGAWWYYKDQVKSHLGLSGPSSSSEKVFACPADRGYGEGADRTVPFWSSKKHNYTSYVFNGVTLPGIPNIAGRSVTSLKEPARTLLVMEFTAHAPLSWHKSRTRKKNTPFYNNAESVVGFVDGHVKLVPIYYDGINAAYTRDPIGGYEYQYSGE